MTYIRFAEQCCQIIPILHPKSLCVCYAIQMSHFLLLEHIILTFD